MTFEELLNQHSIPVRKPGEHEHAREGWIQFDCPYCARPGHFRMGYNLNFNYANCWACGSKPLSETLQLLTGLSYGQLKDTLGSFIPKRDSRYKPKGQYKPPPHVARFAPIHVEYLQSRGYDPETICSTWNVQGIGLSSRLKWRLFIPIVFRGEYVSWTTRSISDKHSHRYINAKPEEEAISLKQILYGWDMVRYSVVICEGPLDVWSIGPGAVATFGLNYTQSQLELLSRIPVRVVCYDNEYEAQQKAKKLIRALSVFPGETFNVVLDAKDPGSADPSEIRELRRRFLG